MATLNTIFEEIKDIPVERLNDVYQFVHSLNIYYKSDDCERRANILSCAGMLSDMSDEDYFDFVKETKRIRQNTTERNLEF